MSKIVNEHATPEQHPDDAAVDRFAASMKAKLAKSRAKGRSGWEDKSLCSAEYLSELLRGHVDKGDPVDVANFCMMLQQRGEGIAAPAQQVEWRTTAVMLEQANAGCRLKPGERIGIVDGFAYPVGYQYVPDRSVKPVEDDGVNRVGFTRVNIPYQGIVDPFLTTDVQLGDKFWFVMKPREVRSLRYVWEYPDFPAGE